MSPEAPGWSPTSWTTKAQAQQIAYPDPAAVERAVARLRQLPPLVTSWEVERLKALLAEAQAGKRFLLQGGDCAETIEECQPSIIANKLKILLQMSLVLIHGAHKPVIRVGRIAGQYAKPRSKPVETKDGATLPSYFGDIVNRSPFTREARQPDPALLLDAYAHAALTLNFVRALGGTGFADLHHPEYWDLSSIHRADLPAELRQQYQQTVRELGSAMRFMEALGEAPVDELTRIEMFTSHEGLSLHYEAAQTRTVPHRPGHYDLTTHLPWIGERTRELDGAHVEFFRGIRNPVGVKLGPGAAPDDVVGLIERLNPADEPGKLILITRMGADRVGEALPPLVRAVKRSGRAVLWVSDPMHGNTRSTTSGLKTRRFDDILRELQDALAVHAAEGTYLGGVHFELTGDDVTECVGAGLTEADLDRNYASACDPRLNYRQALEMAFHLAHRIRNPPPAAR
jgi:3-deoxy-7-phosphoheptulonate synthase